MDAEMERIDRFLVAYLEESVGASSYAPLARLLAVAGIVAARRKMSFDSFVALAGEAYAAGVFEALQG